MFCLPCLWNVDHRERLFRLRAREPRCLEPVDSVRMKAGDRFRIPAVHVSLEQSHDRIHRRNDEGIAAAGDHLHHLPVTPLPDVRQPVANSARQRHHGRDVGIGSRHRGRDHTALAMADQRNAAADDIRAMAHRRDGGGGVHAQRLDILLVGARRLPGPALVIFQGSYAVGGQSFDDLGKSPRSLRPILPISTARG